MKRYNHLYEQICTMENLELAEKHARKGKTNSYGVKEFDKNREELMQNLLQQLKDGTFKTSEYTTFTIYEPKERLIYRLPYYPDRILHHAIMNIMEPIWVSTMVSCSYACLKGRGIHKAVNDTKLALRDKENTRYCLKMDIKKFYPSIDHDELKKVIRKKIKDKRLLDLLDRIIDSAPGVPIGNYLSQFFANIFLNMLDHFIKEVLKIKYYFRYCDDMTIFARTKKELHRIRIAVQNELPKIKLTLKDNYQIFEIDERGVDFLGYVFRHNYTRLRRSTKTRLFRNIKKRSKLQYDLMRQKLSCYFGWLKYCNSKQLKLSLNKYAQYEIF